VKNHITSLLKKLSVHDRTAAVVHALRHRWISLEVRTYSRHPRHIRAVTSDG
jgi:hypothetical protein